MSVPRPHGFFRPVFGCEKKCKSVESRRVRWRQDALFGLTDIRLDRVRDGFGHSLRESLSVSPRLPPGQPMSLSNVMMAGMGGNRGKREAFERVHGETPRQDVDVRRCKHKARECPRNRRAVSPTTPSDLSHCRGSNGSICLLQLGELSRRPRGSGHDNVRVDEGHAET
jgi:hypothetical protein